VGGLDFTPQARRRILEHGVDLYREICCAWEERPRSNTTPAARARAVRPGLKAVGASLSGAARDSVSRPACPGVSLLALRVYAAIDRSGLALAAEDGACQPPQRLLLVNSQVGWPGRVDGAHGVGGRLPHHLAAGAIRAECDRGVDVDEPLVLPREACLEVLPGRGRRRPKRPFSCGATVYATRSSHIAARRRPILRKAVVELAGRCGRGSGRGLARRGGPGGTQPLECVRLSGRAKASGFRRWLWLYAPESASAEELCAFRLATATARPRSPC